MNYQIRFTKDEDDYFSRHLSYPCIHKSILIVFIPCQQRYVEKKLYLYFIQNSYFIQHVMIFLIKVKYAKKLFIFYFKSTVNQLKLIAKCKFCWFAGNLLLRVYYYIMPLIQQYFNAAPPAKNYIPKMDLIKLKHFHYFLVAKPNVITNIHPSFSMSVCLSATFRGKNDFFGH